MKILTIGHRATLKKLQDKKEKSLKDEKALYAAENALEAATQDYNYFNDMMKEELPTLFALEAEFIRPLFQNFYYMQLNIFYTLNEKMGTMQIDYFDFTVDIEEQYEAKRGDVKEQAEALSIVHFKGTGKKRTSMTDRPINDSLHICREIQICNGQREEIWGSKIRIWFTSTRDIGTTTTTLLSAGERCYPKE
jgi:hypothetical protein